MTTVKDMTTEELQTLIAKTVKESIQDILEEIQAFNSDSYLKDIEEAREEYKMGKIIRLEDIPDV